MKEDFSSNIHNIVKYLSIHGRTTTNYFWCKINFFYMNVNNIFTNQITIKTLKCWSYTDIW